MTKRFKPFWFADLIAAEQWLSSMAKKGLILRSFSPAAGVFGFESGESESAVYRICFAKGCGGRVPAGLLSNGWEEVTAGKNHYIVKHSGGSGMTLPSYEGWKSISRSALIAIFMVTLFFVGFVIGVICSMADSNEIDLASPIILTGAFTAAVLMLIFAIGAKGHRRLIKAGIDQGLAGNVFKTIPKENFIYSPEEERQMLKDGRMIKKLFIGWFYSPDRIERRVEEMALNGLKFYRFGEMGNTLYFIRSAPSKLRFTVDLQENPTDEYYLLAKEDGWKLEFTSIVRKQSFIIWTKEYSSDSAPEFYSDKKSSLFLADSYRKFIVLPLFTVCAVDIILAIAIARLIDNNAFFGTLIIFCLLAQAAEYLFFGIRSAGYCLRMRKRYKDR